MSDSIGRLRCYAIHTQNIHVLLVCGVEMAQRWVAVCSPALLTQ